MPGRFGVRFWHWFQLAAFMRFIIRLLQYSAIFAVILFAQSPSKAADQPNILFVYLDDFGWRDCGFMGSDFYETPNIDALASEALVFTDAYSCASNCAPARACLLSGQYTPRHKVYNVGTRPRGNSSHRRLLHVPGVDVLDPKIRTWAHQLKDAGYVTATLGKWHLSKDPTSYGFDLNVGGTHSGGPPKGYYPPHGNAPGLKDAPAEEYVTDRLSEEAIKFIEQNKERPWMVYLTHFAVHTPLQAKKKLLPKYEAKEPGELHDHARMATMIQAVDDGVGRIRSKIEELGLAANTATIFYSDNGGYGPATDMAPLKGYKGCYYEGGIRVPLFIHWPSVVKPGKTNEPVIGVDLFPTLCEMGSAAIPNQLADGKSLVPLAKREVESLGHRAIFWHFPAYLQSYGQVADEQRDPLFRSRPCSIVRQGKWKLHQYFEDGVVELYNLREDISESMNLAEARPDVAKGLLAKLENWQEAIGADIPTDPNPEFDAGVEAEAKRKWRVKGKRRQPFQNP